MILRRYITRQVASTTALVLGFLLVLLLGGRMIRYFGIAAEGRLDVSLLFAIIGYNLPYFLELVLPLSFFIGLMLVFGRLYVDHEMAVLNSSGISRGRLARLIMPLILVLFVIEAGMSMYGKPWGVRNTDAIWQQQSLSSAFDLIRPQSFISSGDYHLYVSDMDEDRTELQDIILVQTAKDNVTKNGTQKDDIDKAALEAVVADNEQRNNQGSKSPAMTDVLEEDLSTSSVSGDGSDNQPELKDNKAITSLTNPVVAAQQDKAAQAGENDSKTASDIDADINANVNAEDSLSPSNTAVNPSSDASRDTIILAKRAVQVQSGADNNKTQLDLYQGRRYEVGADSLVYNQVSFERYRISLERPPTDVVTEDNVTTQPMPVLWKAATGSEMPLQSNTSSSESTVNADGSTSGAQMVAAQAELGYRLALPWLILIAPMLAVPLAQVRPRQGRWLRLVPSIMIFTSCALVIISIKSSVTKGNLSVWTNAVAIVAFIVLALYLNWASRINHRVRFRLGQRALQKQTSNNNDDASKGGQS